jgi:hypothetical protein
MMNGLIAHFYKVDQSLEPEIHSPNEMLVDPDEFVIGPPEGEKDNLAVINPEDLNNNDADQLPGLPLASDCRFWRAPLHTIERG